jgi:hypothetical protein
LLGYRQLHHHSGVDHTRPYNHDQRIKI